MLALALSAVSLLCMMPMGAGATYDACDVNHDGSVDITDVIALNHHLLGTKYYTNYNQLDANRSHTVDKADATCIMSKLVHTSYSACYIRQCGDSIEAVDMPAVSTTLTLDNSVSDTQGRWYVGYSYLENAPISRYQLTPTNVSLNSTQVSYSERMYSNGEEREVAHGYENTGIVATGITGTGFIVGDHEIATAAHCIHTNGQIRTDVEIWTYDRTGELDGNELHIAEIHVPENYSNTGSLYDYALIVVEEDLSDLGYVQFNIGNLYNLTLSEAGTIPFHITGQPDQFGGVENTLNTLYTDFGTLYNNNNTSYLYCTAQGTGGESGAPMYTITRERYNDTDYYTYTALGIFVGGNSSFNGGPLMNKHHLMFYRNNPYANYQ